MEAMRVYVATAWTERVRASAAMTLLRLSGFEVSHDWTQQDAWDWDDQYAVDASAPGLALADLAGVVSSDIFVLLTPGNPSHTLRGCLVEFGIALADPQKIIVIVGDQPRNLFRYHPRVVVVPGINVALAYLRMRRAKIEEGNSHVV